MLERLALLESNIAKLKLFKKRKSLITPVFPSQPALTPFKAPFR